MNEGICITLAKSVIQNHGGLRKFLKYFTDAVNDPDGGWCHKMKNKPTEEFDHVYIIIANRLYGRVFFGGFKHFEFIGEKANGEENNINWPGMFLAGPLEKCPFKRRLKGFQGFRYCKKLF